MDRLDKKNLKIQEHLLSIVHQFLLQLGSEKKIRKIHVNANLDRDLGIDSIGKAELFTRVEKEFTIHLPESALMNIETLHDLVDVILSANPTPPKKAQTFTPHLDKSHVNPLKAKNLMEILTEFGERDEHRPHIYLQSDDGSEQTITYGQLFNMAKRTAFALKEMGIKPRDTVAIMLPTGEPFFYAFFGVLLAGAVPVPIYPPFRPDYIEEYIRHESKILHNAEVRLLITFQQAKTLSKMFRTTIPSLKAITTIDALIKDAPENPKLRPEKEALALIQYTSGSTGLPKGVALSHQNLLANIRGIGNAIQVTPDDVGVSWLPLYHDMGLIGSWLFCLHYGIPIAILSPFIFLQRPERWLWAIHYHRATLGASPNFGYELCVNKIEENDIEGLDLSTWRRAFNGAEAINPKTLERFTNRFSKYGFKATTFTPVYGLAESSVDLTCPPLDREPIVDHIDRDAFEISRKADPVAPQSKNALAFVGCGSPLPEHEVRIVDDSNTPLADRRIGNLQFRGPSTMQGYYRNPEATQAIVKEGWIESGDLAYTVDNEIFITGRKKDVIIKAGRTIYPEDIEEVASHVKGVRKGCIVAFSVPDMENGTESLIIIAETNPIFDKDRDRILAQIEEKVLSSVHIAPDQIRVVPAHTIPKTSSGKLRRSTTKENFVDGKLLRHGLPSWIQVSKLYAKHLGGKTKNFFTRSGRIIYSGYVMLFLGLTIPVVWPSILWLRQEKASKLFRNWCRMMLAYSGCRLIIKGKIPDPSQVVIYAVNHASYLDMFVLSTFLPLDIVFVGKQELLSSPIIRSFMNKFGHLAIDRFDFSKSIKVTEQIKAVLQNQRSVAIFPEGTFTYAAGLQPFKMGTFKLAVETQIPICPVSLKGTRQILRDESNVVRPGTIEVTLHDVIYPQGNDWDEMVRLRTLTRDAIAEGCGEQLLE